MGKAIGHALDFVLATFDISPDEPFIPVNEADLRLQPTADTMTKDLFSVVLWNDDKHSFDEVVKLLSDLTGRSREEALELAHRIDEHGREIVLNGDDPSHMLEVSQALAQIDLGVTIRRAHDTFREEVATTIIEWLRDLAQCRMGTDTLILREIIAEQLLSARKLPPANSSRDLTNPARIDYLFLYHSKLWKRPRLSLKEIYTTVLTLSKQHKLAVGMRVVSFRGSLTNNSYLSRSFCERLWQSHRRISTHGPRSGDIYQILCSSTLHCSFGCWTHSPKPSTRFSPTFNNHRILHQSDRERKTHSISS
jgi:E3 ubiquitin-protein ligase UBR1